MRLKTKETFLAAALALPFLAAGCAEQEKEVSFKNDIQPILTENCLSCHTQDGPGMAKSGLEMTSYQTLITGTRYGPVIAPGDSSASTIVLLVEGKADPSIKMPHGPGSKSLSEEQVALLRSWIDQGALDN